MVVAVVRNQKTFQHQVNILFKKHSTRKLAIALDGAFGALVALLHDLADLAHARCLLCLDLVWDAQDLVRTMK